MLPYFAFHFVIDWWSTRYWSSLAWGLPALVAGLAVWGVGAEAQPHVAGRLGTTV